MWLSVLRLPRLFETVVVRAPARHYSKKSGGNDADVSKPASEWRRSQTGGVGIVGLPNIGKSTLFNALVGSSLAEAANRPFTTIQPNVAKVSIVDGERSAARQLQQVTGLAVKSNALLELVDIAGLVRGASKGLGLGNQFLSNIRSVALVAHVLRFFDDDSITHVENSVDPLRDMGIIHAELILSDLATLERALASRKIDGGVKSFLQQAMDYLESERLLANMSVTQEQLRVLRQYDLLTLKPQLYVLNIPESHFQSPDAQLQQRIDTFTAAHPEAPYIVLASKLEAELALIKDADEQAALLGEYGLQEPCLNAFIAAARRLLRQHSFYTLGTRTPSEVPNFLWPLPIGATAVEAAAQVHTDLAKKFIRAQVLPYHQLASLDSFDSQSRLEGRDYVVQDGDVLFFRVGK